MSNDTYGPVRRLVEQAVAAQMDMQFGADTQEAYDEARARYLAALTAADALDSATRWPTGAQAARELGAALDAVAMEIDPNDSFEVIAAAVLERLHAESEG